MAAPSAPRQLALTAFAQVAVCSAALGDLSVGPYGPSAQLPFESREVDCHLRVEHFLIFRSTDLTSRILHIGHKGDLLIASCRGKPYTQERAKLEKAVQELERVRKVFNLARQPHLIAP